MTDIYCNNQKLVESHRICCFDNKSITCKHVFDEDSELEITFNFHYDENERKFSISSSENGKVIINLYNFTNALGTGLKKPLAIAKYNDHTVSIVFFVTLAPEANPILDYSMYLEV